MLYKNENYLYFLEGLKEPSTFVLFLIATCLLVSSRKYSINRFVTNPLIHCIDDIGDSIAKPYMLLNKALIVFNIEVKRNNTLLTIARIS